MFQSVFFVAPFQSNVTNNDDAEQNKQGDTCYQYFFYKRFIPPLSLPDFNFLVCQRNLLFVLVWRKPSLCLVAEHLFFRSSLLLEVIVGYVAFVHAVIQSRQTFVPLPNILF